MVGSLVALLGLGMAVALVGCSGAVSTILIDGKAVKTGSGFLSSAQLKKKGANSAGIPESAYIFYPSGFQVSDRNMSGFSLREQQEVQRQEIALRGYGRIMQRLTLLGTPNWDHSILDPPTVSHDCMKIQRLISLPWGSGPTQIGQKAGNEGGLVFVPALKGLTMSNTIAIADRASRIFRTFDMAGNELDNTTNIRMAPIGRAPTEEELKAYPKIVPGWRLATDEEMKIYDGFQYGDKEGYVQGTPSLISTKGSLWHLFLKTVVDGLVVPSMLSKYAVDRPAHICRLYFPAMERIEGIALTFNGSLTKEDHETAYTEVVQVRFDAGGLLVGIVTKDAFEVYRYLE